MATEISNSIIFFRGGLRADVKLKGPFCSGVAINVFQKRGGQRDDFGYKDTHLIHEFIKKQPIENTEFYSNRIFLFLFLAKSSSTSEGSGIESG